MDSRNKSRLEIDQLSEIGTPIRGTKRLSGFGVVLDTTRAMTVSGTNGLEVQVHIKLIDPSANPNVEGAQRYINMFAFHNINSQHPFVIRIGDIFRFINFEFSEYRGQPRGKNRTGASWRLFNGREGSEMVSYCNAPETVEHNDSYIEGKIQFLRRWAHKLFIENSLHYLDWYSLEKHFENPQQIPYFDLIARVVEVPQGLQDATSSIVEINVEDEGGKQFVIAISAYHKAMLRVGMIAKLRSIEKIESGRLFPNAKYGAILELPDYFYDCQFFLQMLQKSGKSPSNLVAPGLSQQMMDEVSDADVVTSLQQQLATDVIVSEQPPRDRYPGYDVKKVQQPVLYKKQEAPLRCSIIKNQHKKLTTTSMKDALQFLEDTTTHDAIMQNVKFRMCGYVMDIHPKNLYDAVKYFDEKTGALLDMDQVEDKNLEQSKLKPVYLIRMLWRDTSIEKESKVLATYIFSYDDNPCHVFPKVSIQGKTREQIVCQQDVYEETVVDELLFNPNREYEFLVEPFSVVGNTDLDTLDGQTPLRIKDTMFLEVESSE